MTKVVKIGLDRINDIKRFVELAGMLRHPVIIVQDRYRICGSSLLSMFAIDCPSGFGVEYEEEDTAAFYEFEKFIDDFKITEEDSTFEVGD